MIAVKPGNQDSELIVYDPNFKDGPKKIKKNTLIETVQKTLGHLILVELPLDKISTPIISDPQLFIQEGGLHVLSVCGNPAHLLTQLQDADYTLESLEGILLRNTRGCPAWLKGLQKKPIASFTEKLLRVFIDFNPSVQKELLEESLEALPDHEKTSVKTSLETFIESDNPPALRWSFRTRLTDEEKNRKADEFIDAF